jgi:hypothetical protein
MPEDDAPEQYEYEAPSEQEKQQLVIPPERESRYERETRLKADREQREAEIKRTTALSLAVAWTATADEVPLGAVFGIADLMGQYIGTGKKPTETEFARAVKPYRR